MKIDDAELEYTARAVFIMNESARELYDTWEELSSFIVSMAYRYKDTNTSFSTGGFQLTFFTGHDGEIICRPSVTSYVANRYLEMNAHKLAAQ